MTELLKDLVRELNAEPGSHGRLLQPILNEFERLDVKEFPADVQGEFVKLKEEFRLLKQSPNRVHKVGIPSEDKVSKILDQYSGDSRPDIVDMVKQWTRRTPLIAWPTIVLSTLGFVLFVVNQVWGLLLKLDWVKPIGEP